MVTAPRTHTRRARALCPRNVYHGQYSSASSSSANQVRTHAHETETDRQTELPVESTDRPCVGFNQFEQFHNARILTSNVNAPILPFVIKTIT